MRDLLFYHELEDLLESQLNECYETVSICGFEYEQGTALRSLDPIAFRCAVNDFESEEYQELHYRDLTEDERDRLGANERTVVYIHLNDFDEDEVL